MEMCMKVCLKMARGVDKEGCNIRVLRSIRISDFNENGSGDTNQEQELDWAIYEGEWNDN